MIRPVIEINFTDPTEGIPAFLTILMMPLAYSIAVGEMRKNREPMVISGSL
jgi:AGZA family xanthine/uracil permease-like MFS transporter